MSKRLDTRAEFPVHDIDFFVGQDPLPAFARMRQDAPVYWCEPGNFWVLTRHADVQYALKHPELFSSARGIARSVGYVEATTKQNHDSPTEVPAWRIQESDPPEHTVLRRMINREFAPKAVAAFEPFLRKAAQAVVAGIEPGRPIEIMHGVAQVVPAAMICELMSIPPTDRERLIELTLLWINNLDAPPEEFAAAMAPMVGYLHEFVDSRYGRVEDDIVGRLMSPDEDGNRLTKEEVENFLFILIPAGFETTRGLISLGIHALASCPVQRMRLVNDRSMISSAVEEMLRYGAPAPYIARTTTQPVTINEVEIGADQKVLLDFHSANRDEEVFGPDANKFIVDRSPNPHLSFGFGEHFCIGASLARLEARIFFEELLSRFAHWQVVEARLVPSFEFYHHYNPLTVEFSF